MEQFKIQIEKIIQLMGFNDFSINYINETKRFSIIINDRLINEKNISDFIESLNCLCQLIAKKSNLDKIFIDVNNFYRKRELLVIELAKAAARKSIAEKRDIRLPVMNAYERRLVHMELASHPQVRTESEGEGKERRVVVKLIQEN